MTELFGAFWYFWFSFVPVWGISHVCDCSLLLTGHVASRWCVGVEASEPCFPFGTAVFFECLLRTRKLKSGVVWDKSKDHCPSNYVSYQTMRPKKKKKRKGKTWIWCWRFLNVLCISVIKKSFRKKTWSVGVLADWLPPGKPLLGESSVCQATGFPVVNPLAQSRLIHLFGIVVGGLGTHQRVHTPVEWLDEHGWEMGET